ncbi:hypothetical protein K493DRAFT_412008 [Basidiobolus meristosporus CBS 931.73]|uniref:Uncharacterized protein n=1 Tax=Basidiobolus meristosporus CBS 931.73 TaxID=1314790 RepID=A0A1Y1X639_9FUNG|nr:hypothetical protein K493DRAFT_412008 [Basidiobolus meristosporus CBS 931.73]|eukprot:ORX81253.1 hypothetical protein K493DRAFT_412008 [Basidiobolus meristosporus CBS 931.73]
MPKPSHAKMGQLSNPPSAPIPPSTTPKNPFSSEEDSDSSSHSTHTQPSRSAEPGLGAPPRFRESPYAVPKLQQQQRDRFPPRLAAQRNRSYSTTSSTNLSIHKSPPSVNSFRINPNPPTHRASSRQREPLESRPAETVLMDQGEAKSRSGNVTFDTASDIPLEELDESRDRYSRELPPGFGDDESRSSYELLEAYEDSEKRGRQSKRAKAWPFCCIPCCTAKFCVSITFIIFVGAIIVLCVFLPRVPSSAIMSIQVVGEPMVSGVADQEPPYTFNVSTSLSVVFNNINQYPVTISNLDVNAFPKDGYALLGHTTVRNIYLPSNRMTFVNIPLNMSYVWYQSEDKVWTAFAFACKPELIYLSQKNLMPLRFTNTISVHGLVKKTPIQWQGEFVCPDQ